ncbi:hypothetical protein BS47DRAFT_1401558 [Hydnum rufescens UP504]|uniref:Uncharacterized protein n=1 Tax=Hydnum rufescens UP504 TaxID=1448309 RepID=A0A9P6DI68_9AGAM|nr:hypothetical protein BS47DRAFT_1401558 [Hydnum rufescens UP504]
MLPTLLEEDDKRSEVRADTPHPDRVILKDIMENKIGALVAFIRFLASSDRPMQDIRLYVWTELESIARIFARRITCDWATKAGVNTLVKQSGIHLRGYIYRLRDPHTRFHITLAAPTIQQTSTTPCRRLNDPYTGILYNLLSHPDPKVMRSVFKPLSPYCVPGVILPPTIISPVNIH